MDKFETEVLRFERPLRCMHCPLPCLYPSWMQQLFVTAGAGGMFLGRVQEPAVCCDIGLEVLSADDHPKFYIKGSLCEYMFRCCADVDYQVKKEVVC